MKVMNNEIIWNKVALILVRRQRAQALARSQIKLVQDNKKIRKLKEKKKKKISSYSSVAREEWLGSNQTTAIFSLMAFEKYS